MTKKKEPITNRAKQKVRKHRKTIMFNDPEIQMIKFFIAKYKIQNQSKLFREAIVSTLLRKMEEDHPRLF